MKKRKSCPKAAPITAALLLLSAAFSGCGDVPYSAASQTCTPGFADLQNPTIGKEVPINSPTYGSGSLAQSFQMSEKTAVGSFELTLVRIGTPPVSTLTLKIESDSSGQPSGTVLGSSVLNVAEENFTKTGVDQNISTDADSYYFSLGPGDGQYGSGTGTPVELNATTTYWMVLYASYPSSDTDVIKWMANDTDAYPNGQAMYESPTGTWIDTLLGPDRDFLFVADAGC